MRLGTDVFPSLRVFFDSGKEILIIDQFTTHHMIIPEKTKIKKHNLKSIWYYPIDYTPPTGTQYLILSNLLLD